jgi:hypothetical protein
MLKTTGLTRRHSTLFFLDPSQDRSKTSLALYLSVSSTSVARSQLRLDTEGGSNLTTGGWVEFQELDLRF